MGQEVRLGFLALLVVLPGVATAHRLDEYLQATLIDIAPARVRLEVNLTPGVAVFPAVIALMDTDRDGRVSPEEQKIYASQFLRDLSLDLDRTRLALTLVEVHFPELDEMKGGLGSVQLKLSANVMPGLTEGSHQILFQNRHQSGMSAYLANVLAPGQGIAVLSQDRDERQTRFQVEYSLSAEAARQVPPWTLLTALNGIPGWVFAAVLGILAAVGLALRSRSNSGTWRI